MSCDRRVLLLLGVFCLAGCAEGGIGGTGTISAPSEPLSLDGQANKGPYRDGSQVRVYDLTGALLSERQSAGNLGEFSVVVPAGEVRRIEVSGRFFSELSGAASSAGIALSSVVVGAEGARANVNVATHLIAPRVMELMSGTMSAASAIEAAQSELTLALSGVLPPPANPVDFAELVVINAAQTDGNREGNAWLLALSTILESAARRSAAQLGTSFEDELASLLASAAADFASGGQLAPAFANDLVQARSGFNPDLVHFNLLNLDEALRQTALVNLSGLSATEAAGLGCGVSGDTVLCLDGGNTVVSPGQGGADPLSVTIELEDVVADMNRFLDTDGDGLVNSIDDDDDNDGVPDVDDDTPYGDGV